MYNEIVIKGAREHNLQNIDVSIPRNKFVVVTGVSGSGKSSLTIDTLYAEGQRRYVESLSSYARQFLMRMNKPNVDYIKGISPAIAIEQKVVTRSSRSTVGSLTEIYDYLRLLYARLGKTYSPISGRKVQKHEVSDVVDYILALPDNTRLLLLIPFKPHAGKSRETELQLLLQKGYSRIFINNQIMRIEDIEINSESLENTEMWVLIDRIAVQSTDADLPTRLADSVNTAFYESIGDCSIAIVDGAIQHFSNRFELDGMKFEEPNEQFFNFNTPFGACTTCEGLGATIDIDENLVFPDRSLSVYDNAIAPWRTEKMQAFRDELVKNAHHFDFPIHRPIAELSSAEYNLLWKGNKHFDGLDFFFKMVESQAEKVQYRVLLAKYRGKTTCRTCKGMRLRPEVSYVKIGDKSIGELLVMPISELRAFFDQLNFLPFETAIAQRIIVEINTRLAVMSNMGLGYLSLNRLSSTLSGGETQRINLTRSLGSNLTDAMYILDEPSIGLHPRDTQRLIEVLQNLRDLGNTVLVVEHEEAMMRSADFLIDIGPLAGIGGGRVVFANTPDQLSTATESLTADFLLGRKSIETPALRRKPTQWIRVEQATQHNLKNISVNFPLNTITVVTGVSGSGKTTLVKNILYPGLKRKIEQVGEPAGQHKALTGDVEAIKKLELIDQNPLGRSSRSNPVTYIKAYDAIRDLYADQQLSKLRGFLPKHFSFNVEGGRCEACEGEGSILVEMQFLSDVHLVCEECNGKRFKPEVLDVTYKEHNIFNVLELSVDEALAFFADQKDVYTRLKPLSDVGLGYIKLGQSSSTLSGGEAQRVKLASYLTKGKAPQPILFIFDEPSTGLHFNDISKLLKAFNALIELGHSIIIVEHNLDIVRCADWVIDLGPEGGEAGGNLVFEGTPEDLLHIENSYTAYYLRQTLAK